MANTTQNQDIQKKAVIDKEKQEEIKDEKERTEEKQDKTNTMETYERINYKLKKNGFNEEQVKAFYEVLSQEILPVLNEIKEDFLTYKEIEKLENYFGGKNNLEEVSKQILNWGKKNLSEDILESLSSSYDGIVALHNMMQTNEPEVIKNNYKENNDFSENKLKKMMQDPKYWRDHDPKLLQKVETGFKKLYTK
jgi:hypothetical protein